MSKVILVGSGASFGILGKHAPLSSDFGKSLPFNWHKRYPYLSKLISELSKRSAEVTSKSWALNVVWGYIDTWAKLKPYFGWPFPIDDQDIRRKNFHSWPMSNWDRAGREMRCLLTEVYGDKLESHFQSLKREKVKDLKEVLGNASEGDTIISFNFDLLVEHLLEKYNDVTSSGSFADNHGSGIWLCKPHGSLSWRRKSSSDAKSDEVKQLDRPLKESDIDIEIDGRTVEPGIIAPVPFKSELLDPPLQESKSPNLNKLIGSQWRWLRDSIREANYLIVVGYGFPVEDWHASHIFSDASINAGRHELHVELWERKNQVSRVQEHISRIFLPGIQKLTFDWKGKIGS